jgi:hypothetical protein
LRRFLEDFLKFLYRTLGSIYGRRERLDWGRGRQEFMGADDYQRFGCPDQGVCTSRLEPLSYVLSPLAFESSFVGFKGLLAHFEAPLLGVGRGTMAIEPITSGVCRTLAGSRRA